MTAGKEICRDCGFLQLAQHPAGGRVCGKGYWCNNPQLRQDDDHDGELSFKPPALHFGCTLFKPAVATLPEPGAAFIPASPFLPAVMEAAAEREAAKSPAETLAEMDTPLNGEVLNVRQKEGGQEPLKWFDSGPDNLPGMAFQLAGEALLKLGGGYFLDHERTRPVRVINVTRQGVVAVMRGWLPIETPEDMTRRGTVARLDGNPVRVIAVSALADTMPAIDDPATPIYGVGVRLCAVRVRIENLRTRGIYESHVYGYRINRDGSADLWTQRGLNETLNL